MRVPVSPQSDYPLLLGQTLQWWWGGLSCCVRRPASRAWCAKVCQPQFSILCRGVQAKHSPGPPGPCPPGGPAGRTTQEKRPPAMIDQLMVSELMIDQLIVSTAIMAMAIMAELMMARLMARGVHSAGPMPPSWHAGRMVQGACHWPGHGLCIVPGSCQPGWDATGWRGVASWSRGAPGRHGAAGCRMVRDRAAARF